MKANDKPAERTRISKGLAEGASPAERNFANTHLEAVEAHAKGMGAYLRANYPGFAQAMKNPDKLDQANQTQLFAALDKAIGEYAKTFEMPGW